MKRLARRVVRSAASGVLPWIPIALVTSPDNLGWALTLSFVFSTLTVIATLWVADPVKNLEILDFGYFTIVGLGYLLGSSSFELDMTRWIAEASAAVILVYTAGTLLIGRPFTTQYTLTAVAPGSLPSRDFTRANRVMSGMWVAIFAIQLACLVLAKGVLGRPNDLLFAWLLPIGALIVGFVVNARMTRALIMRESAHSRSNPSQRG